MGLDIWPKSNEDEHLYNRNYPAIDSDGYVESWWKCAVDDYEYLLYGD